MENDTENDNIVIVGEYYWIFPDPPKNFNGQTRCEHLYNHPEQYLPRFVKISDVIPAGILPNQ